MAIIIKEIRVNTVVEKIVVQCTDIPNSVFEEIKEKVVRELSSELKQTTGPSRKER